MSDDRFKRLSREEVDGLTGGGVMRAVPLVKLWDMLRGRSQPMQDPVGGEGEEAAPSPPSST